MDNVVMLAFITGLTAGGLSCFAVQGGLLSGSIAQRVEPGVPTSRAPTAGRKTGKRQAQPKVTFRADMIQPILLFMVAKLVAYTLLGFGLGLLGSMFTFSPVIQGVIQLAIGVFLVGNALRMFNVHPIFRYFSFELPSQVTRFVRRLSKRGENWTTPLFLGALTVLIPCGVTQSMMAVAVGTGSPWLGALIMFAFVLGTSPTFVGVSWLATGLGGMFQKYFYSVVAVIVLVLGVYTVNSGLVLVNSPVSLTRAMQSIRQAAAPAGSTSAGAPAAVSGNVARIDVQNYGYSPDLLTLPADQTVELHLVTNKTRSCSRAFVIPDLGVQELLPASGDTVVTIPPQAAGTTMQFMCSMGMYTGVFQFK